MTEFASPRELHRSLFSASSSPGLFWFVSYLVLILNTIQDICNMFFIHCMCYSFSHLQYTASMSAFTPNSQKASPRDQIRGEIASRGLFSVENGDERPQSLTA